MLKSLTSNTSLIFPFLFVLSVIKPLDYPNTNRYMGALVFVATTIFCLISLTKEQNYKKYWNLYKFEIAIVIIFLLCNTLSLLVNINKFESLTQIVFYSFSSLAVWLMLPMAFLIFSINKSENHQSITWFFLFAIIFVAIWQMLDYGTSLNFTQFFVASDAALQNRITSVTRWHTVLGVIAAFIVLFSLAQLLGNKKGIYRTILFFVLFLLAFYIGIGSTSRNFLLTLAVGLVGLVFNLVQLKKQRIGLLIYLVIAVLFINVLLLNSTSSAKDYGKIFPYIEKLSLGQNVSIADFNPRLTGGAGRYGLWRDGLEFWQESKVLGIGPGVFRVLSTTDWGQQYNLHNYYIQVLVENGLVGFALLLVLLLRLFHRSKNRYFLFAILASLVFDNYLDYSMAWVLSMVWLYCNSPILSRLDIQYSKFNLLLDPKAASIACAIVLAVNVYTILDKRTQLKRMPFQERLILDLGVLKINNVMIDDRLIVASSRNSYIGNVISVFSSKEICNYAQSGRYIVLPDPLPETWDEIQYKSLRGLQLGQDTYELRNTEGSMPIAANAQLVDSKAINCQAAQIVPLEGIEIDKLSLFVRPIIGNNSSTVVMPYSGYVQTPYYRNTGYQSIRVTVVASGSQAFDEFAKMSIVIRERNSGEDRSILRKIFSTNSQAVSYVVEVFIADARDYSIVVRFLNDGGRPNPPEDRNLSIHNIVIEPE